MIRKECLFISFSAPNFNLLDLAAEHGINKLSPSEFNGYQLDSSLTDDWP